MKRRAALICCALAGLFLPDGSRAQRRPEGASSPAPRTFLVRGYLRLYLTERPVENFRVSLKRFTGEELFTVFTRNNGEFEFGAVPGGSYVLVVDESGYEPVRDNLEVAGGSRMGIVLYLRPLGTPAPEPGGAVSARELALPQKAREAFRKGLDKLYARRDIAGSIPHFEKILALQPDFFEALHHLGVAQSELKRDAEAEASLQKCVTLSEGKYAPAQFALAGLMSNSGRFAEALALLRAGQANDTEAWQGHFEMARALMGLNRTDEAEHAALRARGKNANFAPVYLILANIHMRRRDSVSLLGDLEEYLRLAPDGPMSQSAREMRASLLREHATVNPGAVAAVKPPKP